MPTFYSRLSKGYAPYSDTDLEFQQDPYGVPLTAEEAAAQAGVLILDVANAAYPVIVDGDQTTAGLISGPLLAGSGNFFAQQSCFTDNGYNTYGPSGDYAYEYTVREYLRFNALFEAGTGLPESLIVQYEAAAALGHGTQGTPSFIAFYQHSYNQWLSLRSYGSGASPGTGATSLRVWLPRASGPDPDPEPEPEPVTGFWTNFVKTHEDLDAAAPPS